MPDSVTVRASDGHNFPQVVTHDWKLVFCQKCQVIGHICLCEPPPIPRHKKEVPKRFIQTWQYKRLTIEQDKGPEKI